jgi:hypothetical protein
MWEGIVLSHEDGLSFSSLWNIVLDENHDATFPRAVWAEPTQNGITAGRNLTLDAFTLQIRFEDQHSTERTTDVRDATHSDMSLVARECFYRFLALYCRTATTFNGQDIDLRLEGTYTLTPFWDRVGISTTGVLLSFTVVDQVAPCVYDATFPIT